MVRAALKGPGLLRCAAQTAHKDVLALILDILIQDKLAAASAISLNTFRPSHQVARAAQRGADKAEPLSPVKRRKDKVPPGARELLDELTIPRQIHQRDVEGRALTSSVSAAALEGSAQHSAALISR